MGVPTPYNQFVAADFITMIAQVLGIDSTRIKVVSIAPATRLLLGEEEVDESDPRYLLNPRVPKRRLAAGTKVDFNVEEDPPKPPDPLRIDWKT